MNNKEYIRLNKLSNENQDKIKNNKSIGLINIIQSKAEKHQIIIFEIFQWIKFLYKYTTSKNVFFSKIFIRIS